MGKIKELMMEPRDYFVFYEDFFKEGPIILRSIDGLIDMQIPDSAMKDEIESVLKERRCMVITAQISVGEINILEEKDTSESELINLLNLR